MRFRADGAFRQRVALKILGRSSVERQFAFAQERGWRDLNFVQTVGDDYARDIGALHDDGSEWAALLVFKRDGEEVRLFWSSAMSMEMADAAGKSADFARELEPNRLRWFDAGKRKGRDLVAVTALSYT